MRVLFIFHQFSPELRGCAENIALKLAKAAQRAGHSVQALAGMPEHPPQPPHPPHELPWAVQTVHEGVPVTLVPRALMSASSENSFETDELMMTQFCTWMQRQGFDMAHIVQPMRTAFAQLAVQRCGLPYVVSLTDFFPICFRDSMMDAADRICPGSQAGARCGEHCLCPPWSGEGLKHRYLQAQALLAAAGACVCPSQYMADRYQEAFPELAFSVIPHGLDLFFLTSPASATAVPTKNGLTLGYIGTIAPQKGLLTLLRAFSSVPDPQLQLLVIGGFHGDPVYHDEVKKLINADPRVQLIGEVSPEEVARLLPSLDLLCLPAHAPESSSLVLDEAAAAGVPALVSNLGAPGEQVAEFDCGLVLPAGESDAWATAIAEVAARPQRIVAWRANLPLPLRIEEETFFYETLYRRLLHPAC